VAAEPAPPSGQPGLPGPATVAVVGAGIAGLAAAWALSCADDPPRILVLDGAGAVGGKLALADLAGGPVDVGAESMLARRPEGIDLVRQIGLGGDLAWARPAGAWLCSRGQRHPLPAGTLMGVPARPSSVAGLLGPAGVAAVRDERAGRWAPVESDLDVGSFVSSRLGRPVLDLLVEPLLGGVYAGRAGVLSLRATVPGLWSAAISGGSIVAAAAAAGAAERAGPAPDGPGAGGGLAARPAVFAGIRGGLGRLPAELAARLADRGVVVRTGALVRQLRRSAAGWRLVTGPASGAAGRATLEVDAVLLATPAAATARLLGDVAPRAAGELARVEYAGVALVTFVVDSSRTGGLAGSGVLVPPVEGRLVKAATFSCAKWAWLAEGRPGQTVLRASVGRHGDQRDLQLDDDELARRVLADLRGLPGVRLPEPLDSMVTRWGGGLPQYAVGHVDAMDRVTREVATQPGLALAGAAYDGVGVPACVASGRRAAAQLLTHLAGRPSIRGTLDP
jgi:protoporphyrinogen/coproporphyrinogen III oxidase